MLFFFAEYSESLEGTLPQSPIREADNEEAIDKDEEEGIAPVCKRLLRVQRARPGVAGKISAAG